jgi:phosphoenolpyruvate carboxylase
MRQVTNILNNVYASIFSDVEKLSNELLYLAAYEKEDRIDIANEIYRRDMAAIEEEEAREEALMAEMNSQNGGYETQSYMLPDNFWN